MFIQSLKDLTERADACLMDVLLGKYDVREAYAASLALGKRAMEDGYIVTLARPVPLEVGGSWGLDLSLRCDCSHHSFGATHRFVRWSDFLSMGRVEMKNPPCRVLEGSMASLVKGIDDQKSGKRVSLWDLVLASMRFRNDAVIKRAVERLSDWQWETDSRIRKLVHVGNGLTVWGANNCVYLEARPFDEPQGSFWMCEKVAQFIGTRLPGDRLFSL